MNKQYNFAVWKCQMRFMYFSDVRNLRGIPDGDGETNYTIGGLERVKTGGNWSL